MSAPAPSTAAPPGIAALRLATAPQHDAIEALLRLDAAMDLPRYSRVIAGFEAFLAAWEPRVRAALPASLHAWFDQRSRLAFARLDLAALGTPSLPPAHDSLNALALDDAAAAFGSMYVLEGSALGGQVIVRRVAATLGLDAAHGAAYFNGWGTDTGGMWRAFREQLEVQLATEARRVSASRAGARTFEALIAHFSGLGLGA